MLSTARPSKTAISTVDAICDFLEVYIHAILYSRGVYPTLFEDRTAYGIPVKCSRHPELNKYILDVVSTIKVELEKGTPPGDVLVDILDGDGSSIESFVLELSLLSGTYEIGSHDVELRSALIRMSTLESRSDLSDETAFEVCYRPRDGSTPSLEANEWVPRLAKNGAGGGPSPNTPSRLVPLSSINSDGLKDVELRIGIYTAKVTISDRRTKWRIPFGLDRQLSVRASHFGH